MKPVITTFAVGIAAAIVIASMGKSTTLDSKLPPENTEFFYNNGKYTPVTVPGYESVADYPDEYWIEPADFEKIKSHYIVK